MAEAGLPGYDLTSWVALFLPANTPVNIAQTIRPRSPNGLTARRNCVLEPAPMRDAGAYLPGGAPARFAISLSTCSVMSVPGLL